MKTSIKIVFICALGLIAAGVIWAFPDGFNFDGSTGAPGEAGCSCHTAQTNIGSGSIEIMAQGGQNPGDTADVTIAVKNPGQSRWGFAVTVLDNNDLPAGDLIVTDSVRTLWAKRFNGRQYIKQTEAGTDEGKADSTSWQFKWAAPAEDFESVTFYFSALAANNDFFTTGDSNYTGQYSIIKTDVDENSISNLPQSFRLEQNYPNPFNPDTKIEYYLPYRTHVRISVYNMLGRKVAVLLDGEQSAGIHYTEWDGTDAYGNPVAAGMYTYRLETDNFSETKKMLLLK